MVRALIRKATIESMDRKVGDLQGGEILIDGSKIVALSRSIATEEAEIDRKSVV